MSMFFPTPVQTQFMSEVLLNWATYQKNVTSPYAGPGVTEEYLSSVWVENTFDLVRRYEDNFMRYRSFGFGVRESHDFSMAPFQHLLGRKVQLIEDKRWRNDDSMMIEDILLIY